MSANVRCALDLMQRASVAKPSDLKRPTVHVTEKKCSLNLPMLVLAVAFINNSSPMGQQIIYL